MKKRYWLRGGIIAVVVTTISVITIFTCARVIPGGFACLVPMIISPSYPIFVLLEPLFPRSDASVFLSFYVPELLSIPIWFVLGSFLGWLYGEIKNRNKLQS